MTTVAIVSATFASEVATGFTSEDARMSCSYAATRALYVGLTKQSLTLPRRQALARAMVEGAAGRSAEEMRRTDVHLSRRRAVFDLSSD